MNYCPNCGAGPGAPGVAGLVPDLSAPDCWQCQCCALEFEQTKASPYPAYVRKAAQPAAQPPAAQVAWKCAHCGSVGSAVPVWSFGSNACVNAYQGKGFPVPPTTTASLDANPKKADTEITEWDLLPDAY